MREISETADPSIMDSDVSICGSVRSDASRTFTSTRDARHVTFGFPSSKRVIEIFCRRPMRHGPTRTARSAVRTLEVSPKEGLESIWSKSTIGTERSIAIGAPPSKALLEMSRRPLPVNSISSTWGSLIRRPRCRSSRSPRIPSGADNKGVTDETRYNNRRVGKPTHQVTITVMIPITIAETTPAAVQNVPDTYHCPASTMGILNPQPGIRRLVTADSACVSNKALSCCSRRGQHG